MGVWLSKEGVRPEVGMGATEVFWSDKRPCTIVEVFSDRCIMVRRCAVSKTPGSEPYDQQWDIREVPSNPLFKVTLRNNGRWVVVGKSKDSGSYFYIGERRMYYDYSF